MNTSLSKLFSYFNTFATNHNQIASFYTKPLSENTARNLIYPMLWIDVQSLSVAFARGLASVSIPVYMLDRVERDFSNIVEVQSSTLMVINDFLIYFTDQDCSYGFNFNDNASASPVIYEFDDIVCGWTMTVTAGIMDARNILKIPFNT